MTHQESSAGEVSVTGEQRQVARAYLFLSLATLCWASNVVAVKLLLRDVPTFPASLMRVSLAAITLLAAHFAGGKTLQLGWSILRQFWMLGVFGIGLSFICFTTALSYTSVAHVVFIGALTPAVVLLLARWEHQEPITVLKLGGLAVSFAGLLLLELDTASATGSSWKGDLIAAVGLCCFSYYTVRSKRATLSFDSLTLNVYAFAIASLFCVPLLAWQAPGIAWKQVGAFAWWGLIYSGTVGSAGAYYSYYASLRSLTPSQAAALQYVQPVLSTLFGVVLLHETWGVRFGAGAALILAGVFLAERR